MTHKDKVTFIDNFDSPPFPKDKEDESSDEEEWKLSPVDDNSLTDPNHWDFPVPVSAMKCEISSQNEESGFFDIQISKPKLWKSRQLTPHPADAALLAAQKVFADNSEDAHQMGDEITKACAEEAIDTPGSDLAPFTNLPRSVGDIKRMLLEVAKAWNKFFVSKIKGILIDRHAFKTEDPLPNDKVIPLVDIRHCELNMNSLVDKLKVRVVFWGDLYNPMNPQDLWNPHASFTDLKMFMANCTRQRMYPKQINYSFAYLQAKMREQVSACFPESRKKYLPKHLHKCIGRPLILLKALHGYNYSGKFLCQQQAEFLDDKGFTKT